MKHVLIISSLLLAASLAYSAESAPAANASGQFSGKVVESMNAAGYTYVLVDTGSKKVWAAAPQFPVKKGDSVSVSESMPMEHYHSKTLNRDFDLVYFTGSVAVNGSQSGAGGNLNELPKGHPPLGTASTPSKVDFSGLKPAKGGKTVAAICQNREKLKGQEVTVRGKVVKFNANILGRNWLHIRDGSGTEGSNDLLVTSPATAKVGDTVLVTGKVATDKDFGAGYKYGVLLEDAKVVVE